MEGVTKGCGVVDVVDVHPSGVKGKEVEKLVSTSSRVWKRVPRHDKEGGLAKKNIGGVRRKEMASEENDTDPMVVDGEGMNKRRMLAKTDDTSLCVNMEDDMVAGPTSWALGDQ